MRNNEEKRLQRAVAYICAALFAVFAFFFVAVYQAPLLEAFYNEVATGKLDYNPYLVGGVVSLVLTLLALWLNRFARFRREWTALAYLPSALLLAFITDIDRTLYTGGGSGLSWVLIFILGLSLYGAMSFIFRRVLFEKIKDATMAMNRVVWRNLVLLVLLFCLVGALSNSEENFKRETKMMSLFNKGDISDALRVGYTSNDASRELTAMRAYTLAVAGLQGERLFEYPQPYASEGLLPLPWRTSPLVPDSVFALLGDRPLDGEDATAFLSRIAYTDSATQVAKEYYLSSLLLEKRLVKFKDEVIALYGDSSVNKLPKHYREALMLYADIADSASVVPYEIDDAAMRSSLDALRAVEARYSDLFVRGNYVRKEFGRTYWWYFLYSN